MPAVLDEPTTTTPQPAAPAKQEGIPITKAPAQPARAEKRDMDAYFSEPAKKAPAPKAPDKPAPKEPAPQPKPEPDAPEPVAPQKDPEPAPTPKSDPIEEGLDDLLKKPEPKPEVQVGPKELRAAYEKLKREHDSAAKRLKELEPLSSVKDDYEKLVREREDLASRLEKANYLDSPKYKQEWEEPYVKKIKRVYDEAASLIVESENRPGNENDVNSIYALWGTNKPAALAKARELFGQDYHMVTSKLNELKDFEASREENIKNWKETRKQMVAKEQEEASRRSQMVAEAWQGNIEAIRQANPELYSFDDDELNTAYSKAEALADAAFLGHPNLDEEKIMKVQALTRMRAAAFVPIAKKAQKLEARVKELEGILKEYEEGKPEHRGGKGETGSSSRKTTLDRIHDYMK